MNAWRGDAEEALEVRFCWRLSIEKDVGVDESKVLALLDGERGYGLARHGSHELIQRS